MMLVLVLLVWCEFERFWSRNDEEDGKSDEYGVGSTLKTPELGNVMVGGGVLIFIYCYLRMVIRILYN